MKEKNDLIRIYTGSELTVNLLKDELEKLGIPGIIRNEFSSGVSAGFSGGVPSSIDLLIQESDMEKARPVINEFITINKG